MKTYNIRVTILLILILVVPFAQVSAQRCSGCDVSLAQTDECNALLQLTVDQQLEAEAVHLPWGVPLSSAGATNEHVLHQLEYLIGYDDDLLIPLWVANRLTRYDLSLSRPRTECFRRDLRLAVGAASFCEDYVEASGEDPFDRGHLVPSADMGRSLCSMLNTYILSNMTPQFPNFNQRIWNYLEGYVRALAQQRGELYVISSAVFDRDQDGMRDDDGNSRRVQPRDDQYPGRVAVPTHFYKIIIYEHSNGFLETMSILLPHNNDAINGTAVRDAYLTAHLTTIDAIEELTGMDFFSALPDYKEDAIEAFRATALWPSSGN